jgi:hypothetical protein
VNSTRDRRRALRHQLAAVTPTARLRLRGGREVSLVDLSANGALVEGEARLLPGTHVDVHVVTTNGRVLVRSRVVRAYVCTVSRDRVTYRSAIAFEHHVDIGGYSIPGVETQTACDPGKAYPARAV